MRSLLTLIGLGILVAACSTNSKEFVLEGTITGEIKDSTAIYLKSTDSLGKLIEVDTTMVMGGNFSFEGDRTDPKIHYIFIEGNNRSSAPVIIEKGAIDFKAQKDSLPFAKFSGTAQNDFFAEYLEERRRMTEIAKSISDDMRSAQMERDTAAAASLREEYFENQEKSKNYDKEFAKTNTNSIISALLINGMYARKSITEEETLEMFDALSDEVKNSEAGKRLKQVLDKIGATKIGAVAPSFEGPNPDGDLLALNDVKGKLTLIDFWAGWCKPCRLENPNVVNVYNKYKDKGFNVVGVSLDKTRASWEQAIEQDNLTWNHVSHLSYFNGPIAKKYNINSIPAAFLIDENGVIVAKNLRGPALEQKVAELLN